MLFIMTIYLRGHIEKEFLLSRCLDLSVFQQLKVSLEMFYQQAFRWKNMVSCTVTSLESLLVFKLYQILSRRQMCML
ncbi:hypothetical protein AO260_28430 [Pseudomonas sp. ABAC21]|nr:hypothetical protein AO260_28430 [Pseudomonas sp. ABAC21]